MKMIKYAEAVYVEAADTIPKEENLSDASEEGRKISESSTFDLHKGYTR